MKLTSRKHSETLFSMKLIYYNQEIF